MTRINVVNVATLSDKHLTAEYRELPRIFALAYKASQSPKPWTNKQPNGYKLGESHVIFFYDKLLFLAKRQKQIIAEMQHRGFNPQFTDCLIEQWRDKIPASYWKDYTPTSEAIAINLERINLRLAEATEKAKQKAINKGSK